MDIRDIDVRPTSLVGFSAACWRHIVVILTTWCMHDKVLAVVEQSTAPQTSSQGRHLN